MFHLHNNISICSSRASQQHSHGTTYMYSTLEFLLLDKLPSTPPPKKTPQSKQKKQHHLNSFPIPSNKKEESGVVFPILKFQNTAWFIPVSWAPWNWSKQSFLFVVVVLFLWFLLLILFKVTWISNLTSNCKLLFLVSSATRRGKRDDSFICHCHTGTTQTGRHRIWIQTSTHLV